MAGLNVPLTGAGSSIQLVVIMLVGDAADIVVVAQGETVNEHCNMTPDCSGAGHGMTTAGRSDGAG